MFQDVHGVGALFLDAIKKNAGLTITAGIMLLMGLFAMVSPLPGARKGNDC